MVELISGGYCFHYLTCSGPTCHPWHTCLGPLSRGKCSSLGHKRRCHIREEGLGMDLSVFMQLQPLAQHWVMVGGEHTGQESTSLRSRTDVGSPGPSPGLPGGQGQSVSMSRKIQVGTIYLRAHSSFPSGWLHVWKMGSILRCNYQNNRP